MYMVYHIHRIWWSNALFT